MIHKLSFKNFYSFKDEVCINFKVNKKAPKTDAYIKGAGDFSLTKILTIVGANASGKTNLLKALPFLRFFIVDSFSQTTDEKNPPFKPFLFDQNNNSSEFLVEFQIKENIYSYKLILNASKVISEKLKVKIDGHFSTLFKREWNNKEEKYLLNVKKYSLPSDFSSLLRDDASIISTARQIDHKLSLEIIAYWQNFQTNIDKQGRTTADDNIFNISEFFYKNPSLKEIANDLLVKFDLGLSGIKILEYLNRLPGKEKEDTFYFPMGVHKSLAKEGSFVNLSFFDESSGTQHLFLILSKILKALETGSIVILDEFDTYLHPSMIPELVNLFISPEFNKNNAQLFFSTHHPLILNSLDKYQIILCEKDEDGCSESWRLDDIEGVRSDDNYYAKYMSGAYGAIPHL